MERNYSEKKMDPRHFLAKFAARAEAEFLNQRHFPCTFHIPSTFPESLGFAPFIIPTSDTLIVFLRTWSEAIKSSVPSTPSKKWMLSSHVDGGLDPRRPAPENSQRQPSEHLPNTWYFPLAENPLFLLEIHSTIHLPDQALPSRSFPSIILYLKKCGL